MHVVAHHPQAWYLLQVEQSLLLDVPAGTAPMAVPMLIRLTEAEVGRYRETGAAYLDELALRVRERAFSEYWPRNLDRDWHAWVRQAVAGWQGAGCTAR